MGTVLKRTVRPWPSRPACFVKLEKGVRYEDGTLKQWGHEASLKFVLEIARDCKIVYLVGGWDGASMPVTEWFIAPEGWERVVYHRDPLIAVYKHEDGRKVTLYSTAQWFGKCENASLCRSAYVRLRELLRSSFDRGVDLLGTPARTGLDLLERSLPCNKDGVPYEYPVLDADLREMIEHNMGQGRMEFLREGGTGSYRPEKLYVLDANWMYAACLHTLPALPIEHRVATISDGIEAVDLDLYRCGIYRVNFNIPENWHNIGLLPVWDKELKRTVYPEKGTNTWDHVWFPFESIVGEAELRLAVEQKWPLMIKECWLFADEKANNARPARKWSTTLRTLREACKDEREGLLGPLLRSALRALLIKAIGGFHRRGRVEQVETPHERAEEVDPMGILEVTPTTIRWERPIAIDPHMAAFQHPEWSAIVWSRARARLARAALEVGHNLIGLRTDALLLSNDPHWEDDGKPGTFRLKEVIPLNGKPVPHDEVSYRKLLREVKNG